MGTYSLPGADRIAINTGAIVIANGEAINVLRQAGVPEDQLVPVSGGERIPLFTKETRLAAVEGTVELAPGPPGAPPRPAFELAAASVHVWPSLHCLMPGKSHADIPDVMDTGKVRCTSLSYHQRINAPFYYVGIYRRREPVCLHTRYNFRNEIWSPQNWRPHASRSHG